MIIFSKHYDIKNIQNINKLISDYYNILNMVKFGFKIGVNREIVDMSQQEIEKIDMWINDFNDTIEKLIAEKEIIYSKLN